MWMTRSLWQICLLAGIGGLSACAPPAPPAVSRIEALPELHSIYDRYPARLFAAVPVVCTDPAQRVTRPTPDIVECRSLLPPSGAAAAILLFDGTLERLPESVIRFRSEPEGHQHAVRATAFVVVERSGGERVQMALDDPRVTRRLSQILRAAGGRPAGS